MSDEAWNEKVKQYRLAVGAYCAAVDRLETTSDLEREWQQIEVSREDAERAWSTLARLRRKPLFARIQSLVLDEGTDRGTEELVLGDLGQHGG